MERPWLSFLQLGEHSIGASKNHADENAKDQGRKDYHPAGEKPPERDSLPDLHPESVESVGGNLPNLHQFEDPAGHDGEGGESQADGEKTVQ
jgi:hypothetical protein